MNSTKTNQNLPLALEGSELCIYMVVHVPLVSRTGTLSHNLPFRFCIHLQLYQYGAPSTPSPAGFPWLLLLASSAVRHSQLVSSSPLCHLVMKRSAASTIPRRKFPLIGINLAALGHGTVPTPNSKEELSVDPSIASNTLMSSARLWAQYSSAQPRPGLTPRAIVPNVKRWVGRSLLIRCTAPAKRRRRLQLVVSTLSHCASSLEL